MSAVPVSAHPPPLVITTKLAAGGHIGNMEGLQTTNINILSSTAPVQMTATMTTWAWPTPFSRYRSLFQWSRSVICVVYTFCSSIPHTLWSTSQSFHRLEDQSLEVRRPKEWERSRGLGTVSPAFSFVYQKRSASRVPWKSDTFTTWHDAARS